MSWSIDLLVILIYFVVVIGIGLAKGRGESTMEGFAMGGRQMPWWAVLASILAAEISAATFLGAPDEGYALKNFTYAQLAIGTVLARVIVAYLFIKPFYDYRVVSIYEFLRIRFGVQTKNAASIVFLVGRSLASGARLYVAAILLVFGYQMWSGVKPSSEEELAIYVGALTAITLLTAVYTTTGGIKAVVWTDVIQACVMFGALAFAIWTLLDQIPGGWDGAMSRLTGEQDLRFLDTGPAAAAGFWQSVKGILEAKYTIWVAFLGSTFVTMATHGTDQDMVQRMLTAKDHHRSRLALIASGLADVPVVLAFLLVGILLWVFYQVNPDPDLPKSVFAWYILHELPTGIRGLVIAGFFATAMGSLSTALNALATSFTKDWYVAYIRPGAGDRDVVRAARWSTVVFSGVLILIGSMTAWATIKLPDLRIIPIVLGIFGYTYGSLLGIFLLGMVTRARGSERGNVIAMICGFLFVSWLSGLHNDCMRFLGLEQIPQPSWLPVIGFPWRVMFGTLLTFAIAVLFRTPDSQIQAAAQQRAQS